MAGRVLRGLYAGLSREEILSLDEEHAALHILEAGEVGTLYPDPALIEG